VLILKAVVDSIAFLEILYWRTPSPPVTSKKYNKNNDINIGSIEGGGFRSSGED
jgi:hypothetical protein